MSNEFEIAGQTRESMIYEKQDLLRPLAKGMLATPHPMPSGTADTDYYQGKVSGPTHDQVDWVREHRPDDPSLNDVSLAHACELPAESAAPQKASHKEEFAQ